MMNAGMEAMAHLDFVGLTMQSKARLSILAGPRQMHPRVGRVVSPSEHAVTSESP